MTGIILLLQDLGVTFRRRLIYLEVQRFPPELVPVSIPSLSIVILPNKATGK